MRRLICGISMLVAIAPSLCGCRPTPPAVTSGRSSVVAAAVTTATLGIGVRSESGGRLVATGVLARTPSFITKMRASEPDVFEWVLFSTLGTDTAGPHEIAFLVEPLSHTDPKSAAVLDRRFGGYDGKLVTVEGIGVLNGANAPAVFSKVTSVKVATEASQSVVPSLGSFVRSGLWWKKWGAVYLELWSAEDAGRNYHTLDAALERITFRPVMPPASAAGKVLGVFVDDASGRSYRGVSVLFSEGFSVSARPATGALGLYDEELAPAALRKLRSGTSPPYPRAIDIAGHKGRIDGFRKYVQSLSWRDGDVYYSVNWVGDLYQTPPAMKFVDIARSCYR